MKETFICILRGARIIVPLTILASGYGFLVASLPFPYGGIVLMVPWLLLMCYLTGQLNRS